MPMTVEENWEHDLQQLATKRHNFETSVRYCDLQQMLRNIMEYSIYHTTVKEGPRMDPKWLPTESQERRFKAINKDVRQLMEDASEECIIPGAGSWAGPRP